MRHYYNLAVVSSLQSTTADGAWNVGDVGAVGAMSNPILLREPRGACVMIR